ncbi:MAG: hypothetical protein WAW52_09215, partial [Methanothrix sp.]
LGDIGPIIISLEEITCCYLVKCKLVLATGYYYEIYNKTGTLPKVGGKWRLTEISRPQNMSTRWR